MFKFLFNLLDVELEQVENKLFLDRLEKSPPDLFRKGINLDRPTCNAALEHFRTGHREERGDIAKHKVGPTTRGGIEHAVGFDGNVRL